MPYVEILGPRAAEAGKQAVVGAVTRGIVESFGVPASTVTIYFQPIERENYAHQGVLGELAQAGRIFVKVHAYRRSIPERRAVAAAITPVLADCFQTSADNVAVYFFDREQDEVAHGGRLASDEAEAAPHNFPAP
jgi:phenylpyruvate tautomerase PptA (4-oxalocrotonate tautomerase family)